MAHTHCKLSSQGQLSVPASGRRAWSLSPGSMHDSQAVHDALFPKEESPPPAKSLDELKQGVRACFKRRHSDEDRAKLP